MSEPGAAELSDQETFRALLDAAPDPTVVVGERGLIVFANLQVEHILGYAPRELLGQPVEVLIPERYRAAHHGYRARFFADPRVRPMGSGLELYCLKRDGSEIPIEISLSPVTTGGRTLVSAAIRDITERKKNELELRRARSEAEAASSAKSEFLSSMSHELRTPLNAILGFAQLLHRDKKEPLSDRHRERIEHVLKGGEHLLRLIDDILDLSRIEAGRVTVSVEPVEVAEVLREVETTLAPIAARADIAVRVAELPDGLPPVAADRTRFKQILMNYGSNAIKYGRPGGQVTFRVAAPEVSPVNSVDSATSNGTAVRVTVEDDGIGIPADKQDRIFSPFHRAGQETGSIEGTGIGLAISKRLAELMDGRVGFTSEPGQGSAFWVELAARHERSRERPAPPQPAPAGSSLAGAGARFTIVYIEDNPSNVAFMADLLADYERIDLVTAPTAELGLELIRARRPSAVIMDINLPGMSGIDAIERLRAWPQTRALPVIALSAAAMVRDAKRIEEAGFYRSLTKPVKVDELAAVLEELLLRDA